MSNLRIDICRFVRFRSLIAVAGLIILTIPHLRAQDGMLKVRYSIYWEGRPPGELIKQVIICSEDGEKQTFISPTKNDPLYFWQHVSNLLSNLSVSDGAAVVVKEEKAAPEVFVVYGNSATFNLRRAHHSVHGQIYDRKNYVEYLIDHANREIGMRSRPSLSQANTIISRIAEIQEENPVTSARLQTKLVTTLVRTHDFIQDDKLAVNHWFESTCQPLREKHKALATELLSSVVSAMAATPGREWHVEGLRLLKRAIADDIEPRYGAGDLWEALRADGAYQKSYDLAFSACELFLDRGDAENVRWFRRALTSLQKLKAVEPSGDFKAHSQDLKSLLEQRSNVASPSEMTLLLPLLREVEILTQ